VFTAIDQNASDMIRNVSRLELYRPGETTPFASAYAAACGTSIRIGNSFCVLMHGLPLVVQKNTVTEILVRPRMNTDADGAVSGQNLRLTINRDSGFDPSGNTVTAQGVSSSNVLTFNNGNNIAEGEVMIGKDDASANYDITGNSNTVVLSKIATVTNADPHPNGSMIPMGPGADIGQFKFTAAANNNFQNGPNKVALGTVLFSVNASNVLVKGDSFKGFRSSDSTSVVLCYPMGANGSALSGDVTGVFFVSCAFSGSPVNNIIDGGTDATFGLRADILNAKINSTDSVLQVSLTNFADSLQASFGPAASHLSWRDQDNGGSTVFWWIESPVTTVNGTTYVQ